MKTISLAVALCLASNVAYGYTPSRLFSKPSRFQQLSRQQQVSPLSLAASATAANPGGEESLPLSPAEEEQQQRLAQIRKEGGLFAFDTKYGALNPFAIYYGLTSIVLGLPWFVVLSLCNLLYKVTNNRVDKLRRLPIFFSQIWGTCLMYLTYSTPEIENYDIIKKFYERNEAAMFVANHNSWMDIPFVGYTIGWRNYKLISKAELGKVPILGTAIKEGGHIMVDRTNRRSQLKTLKDGMQMLKDGVHLCTFPEGTRTRSGKLGKFKNGAFKMAHKVGAPVVPLSIVNSGKAMPHTWMFPRRPSHGYCKVVVHEPVESKGKTEDELAEEVRKSIIAGLPEDQRP